MDFHLLYDNNINQWQWRFTPNKHESVGSEVDKAMNFEILRESGNSVGIIFGWTDLDKRQIIDALRKSELDKARSLLCSAEGTFSGIFLVENQVFVVTDVSGSIPIFFGYGDESISISSKAEIVASSIDRWPSLDLVSMADFLQNGAVCHPYTLYTDVRIFSPGSVAHVSKKSLTSSYYWTPNEQTYSCEFSKTAKKFRETIKSVLEKALGDTSDVTVMYSGGEDARSLVSLLPNALDCRLKLITNGENREYALARKSAQKLGLRAELITRDPDHYRKQFYDKVHWVGAGNDIRHLHVFGRTEAIMNNTAAVVGGLGSDKLFKSDYLGNVVNKSKESFLPERLSEPCPDKLVGVGTMEEMKWMHPDVAEAVQRRHQLHHEKLREFRPKTSGNWHTLWPLGGHSQAHSQFLSNIRYRPRVVEPFLAASSYKLAAAIPDEWKVDRKIFTAALVPGMGRAAWVPTTAGRLPAMNGLKGRLVQFAIKSWRLAYDEWQKKRHSASYGDQGPWSSDHKAFEFDPCEYLDQKSLDKLNSCIDTIVSPDLGRGGFWNLSGIPARQRRVMAVQIGQIMSDE